MAEMPDLDPANVSWVAWWNLMDHADPVPDSINPEDTLSAYSFAGTEYYDNGIIAEYSADWGQSVFIRVKSDGWFVGYMESSNDFYSEVETDASVFNGQYMIAGAPDNTNLDLEQNLISDAIQSMASELNVYSDVTFQYGDVGLYNYESEGSNAVYLNGSWGSYTWYYTGETPKYMSFVTGVEGRSLNGWSGTYTDEATGYSASGPYDGSDWIYAAGDAVSANPSEGTEYSVTLSREDTVQDGNFTYIGVY